MLAMFAATSTLRGQAPPAALVAVSPVVEREVTAGQTFVGTVMPLRKSIVGSAVDGRVIEYPLNEGDRVQKGQVLAHLLTDTVKLQLAAAEAELDLRKQQLAELKNGTRPEEIRAGKGPHDGGTSARAICQRPPRTGGKPVPPGAGHDTRNSATK